MAGTIERESVDHRHQVAAASSPVAIVGGVALLIVLRLVAGGALGIVWAEDGGVFYATPVTDGAWSSLIQTHGGYLQTFPAVLGNVVAALPVAFVPYAFALLAGLTIGVLAWFVFDASASAIESPSLRLVLCAAFALIPPAAHTAGSIAMLHFYLLFAAFWAFYGRPSNRLAAAILVGTTALSTATALGLAPLAAWRGRERPLVAGVYAVTMPVQVGVMMVSERNIETASRSVSNGVRSFLSTTLNSLTSYSFGSEETMIASWVVIACVLTLAVAATRRQQLDALVVTGFAAVFWAGSYASSGWTTRYAIVPALCLVATLLILVQDRPPVVSGALVAALLFAWTLVLPSSAYRSYGPTWHSELERGRQVCAQTDDEFVALEVAPTNVFPLSATVACDRL